MDQEIRRLEREATGGDLRAKVDLVRAYIRAGRRYDAGTTITDLIQTYPKDAIIRYTHSQFFETIIGAGDLPSHVQSYAQFILNTLPREALEELQDEMVKLSQAYRKKGDLHSARGALNSVMPDSVMQIKLKGETRKECARLALDYYTSRRDIGNARQLLEAIIRQERPIRFQLPTDEEIQRWYDNRPPITSTRITYNEQPEPVPEVTNHRKAMNLDKARENLIKLIETSETLDAAILHEYNLLFRNPWLLYDYVNLGDGISPMYHPLCYHSQERRTQAMREDEDNYFLDRARGVRPERHQ